MNDLCVIAFENRKSYLVGTKPTENETKEFKFTLCLFLFEQRKFQNLRRMFFNNYTCIVSTKTKSIRECNINGSFFCFVECEI